MNSSSVLLGAAAVLLAGGIAYAATRDEEEDKAGPEQPPVMPPIVNPNIPPAPPFQWPPVPPSPVPILGGQYVDSINAWCPPGYLYNGESGLCEALQAVTINPSLIQEVTFTQGHGTGACCASCATGGPCVGCDDE